ncbi:MAG: BTAD domain-containing putative transcriptional regulator, partial [Chloroflexota bacterium]
MHTISAQRLNVSLFGSLQLHHSNQGEIKENRRKVQALLIWLLLEDNQAHSREQLIALLWPEMSRKDGLSNLRVALSRVKKHLADKDALEAKRSEVTLHQSPYHTIDVRVFESLIEQVDHHQHSNLPDCEACLGRLRKATELYRGRFLDGFSLDDTDAFDEWLFVWRERYHVMGLAQLGRLAEIEFKIGDLAKAEALAARQIKIDSLQESAHRMLMRISAERGDRTQALRQFQTCAKMLTDELGVPPEEETLHLKQQIEAGQYKLRTKLSPQPAKPSRKTAGQMPEIITPFIGREEELTLLAERLTSREYRLVSLIGPGGIGKTRLAIQAAKMAKAGFNDGAFFVPLVGLSNYHDIPAAVAEATGFSLQPDDTEPKDQIANILATKEILLIIDNLEHIIKGADILLEWLEKAPNMMLLVTSRERINAQAEDLFRLKGLPWPKDRFAPDATSYEAVRLFGDRAHRLNKTFWLNEDTIPSVVRICQQVEGLPLALELAATSIRDFDVEEIADALAQEPEILSTDLRDVPSRHRQIESVFDYSWRLLTEAEQAVLAQLSQFAGGFTLKAARAVTGSSAITLTHLRYKSLIRAEGNGRFSMHELLRQLAEKKLHLSTEQATTTKINHADYFIELVC